MARRTEEAAAPPRRRAKAAQAEETTTRKARAAKSEEPTRRRRGRTEEAEESEEVTTKARRKKTAAAVAEAFDPYAALDKELDKIEKTFGLSSTGVDPWEERMSTGLLMLDLILGGGIVGGNWYTNFGPEQSTKTTGAIAILAMALLENVPVINFYDYENSFQPDYFEAVVATLYRALGLTPLTCNEIFGIQDSKGNWVQRPRIRRYQEAVAEKFFNSIAKTLKVLPEKRRIGDSWYYLYEDTKEHRKLCEGRYDKNYLSKTGMLKVEAQDGRLQGIALVDSYPAMLPEAMDEKEENGNGMAAQARMFSDQIKRVKGRLRGRRFTVLGVNQVRQKPAAMFSNPEYEPCGDALKFYCMSGDTLLHTSDGMLKAEEIEKAPKLMVGMKGAEKPAAFFTVGRYATTEVTTEHGFRLRGRPGHAVYALRRHSRVPEWVKLSDLTREHYVAVKYGANLWPKKNAKIDFADAIRNGQNGNTNRTVFFTLPKVMDEKLARVFGYLVSEGYVRNGRVIFTIADADVFADFCECFKHCFGVDDAYIADHTKKKGTFFVFDLTSEQLGQYLRFCGLERPSNEKEIPLHVRMSSETVMRSFLQALFEGDGHIGVRDSGSLTVSYASTSSVLVQHVSAALLNYGILSKSRLNSRYCHEAMNENVNSGLSIYGHYADQFLSKIGFISQRKRSKSDKRGDKGSGLSMFDRMPDVFNFREVKKKAIGRGRHFYRYDRLAAGDYRTAHEREANEALVNSFNALAQFTEDHGIFWSKVDAFVENNEPEMVYDCNMPQTSSVVTNGILSHNSDVRLRYNSRSLSGVPYASGKGQIEEEKSIHGKGNDSYRYIHVRAHKNKLSTPGLDGWLRVWVSDRKGKAHGYCPVWDTFMYLIETGQIECASKSSRGKLFLRLKRFDEEKQRFSDVAHDGVAFNWDTFKKLIIGTNEQIKEACAELGLKSMRLRKYCFSQMKQRLEDGTLVGIHLMFTHKYAEGVPEKGEEDDEPSDGDEE